MAKKHKATKKAATHAKNKVSRMLTGKAGGPIRKRIAKAPSRRHSMHRLKIRRKGKAIHAGAKASKSKHAEHPRLAMAGKSVKKPRIRTGNADSKNEFWKVNALITAEIEKIGVLSQSGEAASNLKGGNFEKPTAYAKAALRNKVGFELKILETEIKSGRLKVPQPKKDENYGLDTEEDGEG